MVFRNFLRRARHLYYTRILRQRGEPSYLARGVALGLLIGWTVPIGFQLVLVLPLAFLARAAKIPTVLATFVSNHFTVFLLYPMQCYVGSLILRCGWSYDRIASRVAEVSRAESMGESWRLFCALGGELAGAFFVGGLVFGVPSAIFGYFFTLFVVTRYRRLREKLRMRAPVSVKDDNGN